MTVSKGTVAVAVVCSIGLGAICTWAILDGPAQELLVDNGNVADWLAAVGTWFVGIAAAWVAWSSHKLQLADRVRRRFEDARANVIRVGAISTAVNSDYFRLNDALRDIRKIRDGISAGLMDPAFYPANPETLEAITISAQRLTWSLEDRSLFGSETQKRMLTVAALAQPLAEKDSQSGTLLYSFTSVRASYVTSLRSLVAELKELEKAMKDDTSCAKDELRSLQKESAERN